MGKQGGKWWGGLVARWQAYNCSMPVFRAWHSLSVFFVVFFFFFLTPSHPAPHPLVLITNPLPSSAPHSTHKHTQTDSSPPVSHPLPVLHPAINSLVYNAPRFLSVDNKMKRKQTKKKTWRIVEDSTVHLLGTSSSAFQPRWYLKPHRRWVLWRRWRGWGWGVAALLGKVKVDSLLLMW